MNKVLEECALVKLKSLELSLKLAFNLEILFPEIFRDYPDFGGPQKPGPKFWTPKSQLAYVGKT